jgi:CheY-like chemotaxis protein
LDFLRQLFGSGDFQPHGFCYLWNARLVWLHAISDLVIALAYFAIPVTLVWFIRKRRDLPFSWIFVCFGVFIVACGATHEIWNLWHANYWLAGVIKAVTAAASIVTALLLVRLVPQALDLPSPQQWLFANAALQKEVQDRRELEFNLRISDPFARLGDYVMLSVTDTGTGMDAATVDRIFEPFFTTKQLGKGTGLGLATVYGMVGQHGGFTHVYSKLGIGTTFRTYFPAALLATKSVEAVEDTQPVRGGVETILVVEDHPGLRELAFETLTNLGYKVILASDGEQGLREFESRRDQINLLLLDVVLPKLSGPHIYSRICEIKPDVLVIFATGYSADMASLQKELQKGLPILQKATRRAT